MKVPLYCAVLLLSIVSSVHCISDIHKFSLFGNSEEVRNLIRAGVDANLRDQDQRTPLDFAVVGGQKGVVELLLYKKAMVDSRDKNRQTPLHKAAHWSRNEIVELLLKHNADMQAQDFHGKTPLHLAGNNKVVMVLIKAGADLNALDYGGNTPLHDAARAGREDVVQALVQSGAQLDIKNKAGKTAFDVAGQKVNDPRLKPSIQQYLKKMSVLSKQLHSAARAGDINKIKRSIDAGAPLNTPDNNGDTPLHLVVRSENPEALKYVLQFKEKLNIHLRNNERKTAIEEMAYYPEMEKVFRQILSTLTEQHGQKTVMPIPILSEQ